MATLTIQVDDGDFVESYRLRLHAAHSERTGRIVQETLRRLPQARRKRNGLGSRLPSLWRDFLNSIPAALSLTMK